MPRSAEAENFNRVITSGSSRKSLESISNSSTLSLESIPSTYNSSNIGAEIESIPSTYNSSNREAGTLFVMPTPEEEASVTREVEALSAREEALKKREEIVDIKSKAAEILTAAGETSGAVNKVVGVMVRLADAMVTSSEAGIRIIEEDAEKKFRLAKEYAAERELFDSTPEASNITARDSFTPEIETIQSSAEYPGITRRDVVEKAGKVARIGEDVRKAEEAARRAIEVTEAMAGTHEVTETTRSELSKAEDVVIGSVLSAIDVVREAETITPALKQEEEILSIEEAKGVVTKVAAKLFTKGEVKAETALHTAVDAEVQAEVEAARYTVLAKEKAKLAKEKAEGYIAGFTAAVKEAKTGEYTPKYAEAVKAAAKVEEWAAVEAKEKAEGHIAASGIARAEKANAVVQGEAQLAAVRAAEAAQAVQGAVVRKSEKEVIAYVNAKITGYIEAKGYIAKESETASDAKIRGAAAYAYKLAVNAPKAREGKLFSS